MRPVASDAFAHGADKGLNRPCPDTGFQVRSNIRPIDDPERRIYSISARESQSAASRMTRGAMSSRGQRLSFGHRLRREFLWGWALKWGDHRPPRHKQEAGYYYNSHY